MFGDPMTNKSIKPNPKKTYVNTNEYRIAGMFHSGHGIIANWITCEYVNKKKKVCYLPEVMTRGAGIDPYNAPRDNNKVFGLYNMSYKDVFIDKTKPKDSLVLIYDEQKVEDVFCKEYTKAHDKLVGKSENVYNILVIRDPLNQFASRLLADKRSCLKLKRERRSLSSFKATIALWKEYAESALSGNYFVINYDKWVEEPDYRDEIISTLTIPSGGSSSSLTPAQDLGGVDIWKQIPQSHPFFFKIFEDKELVSLVEKLYGKDLIMKMAHDIFEFETSIDAPEELEEINEKIEKTPNNSSVV